MREKIPPKTVLEWLNKNHPELVPDAALDRNWIWLTTNLKGDDKKPVRESLKQNGWRFAFKPHKMADGREARWANNCGFFKPFRKRKPSSHASASEASHRTEPEDDLAEAAEFFNQ
jgi:hypothetical protein